MRMTRGRVTPWVLFSISVTAWLADHSIRLSGHVPSRWATALLRPEGFHPEDVPSGNSTTAGSPPYFEGWYIKVVDDAGQTFAFIVGAFYGSAESHAFVLTLDEAGTAKQFKFPLSDFQASSDVFSVQIGPNRFSTHGLEVHLEGVATGRLDFIGGAIPWPIGFWEPGVMGWFAWLPGMECRHVVPSLTHAVTGTLRTGADGNGAAVFSGKGSGAHGYIEGDRGRQFPSAWIWLQTNGFAGHPGTSLSGSIAKIPYLGINFPGHIVGLLHDGMLYRFTTYTGAVTTALEVNASTVEWRLEDARHGLEITVDRTSVPAGKMAQPLWGPRSGQRMDPYVNETLGARVGVRLFKKMYPWQGAGGETETLFEGVGDNAGLEIMATAEQLSFPGGAAARSLRAATPLGNPIAGALLVMAAFARATAS